MQLQFPIWSGVLMVKKMNLYVAADLIMLNRTPCDGWKISVEIENYIENMLPIFVAQ